jgi:glutathione S-transferase
VIEDGDRVLAESAVLVEYICHTYAGGWLVSPAQPNYYDYLYRMHLNNNAMGLRFAKSVLGASASGPVADAMGEVVNRREKQYYDYLDKRLGEVPYLPARSSLVPTFSWSTGSRPACCLEPDPSMTCRTRLPT